MTMLRFSSTAIVRSWHPSLPSPKNEWGTRWRKTSPSNPPVAKAIIVLSDEGSSVAGTARRMKFGILRVSADHHCKSQAYDEM